jgi:hypothetical protein
MKSVRIGLLIFLLSQTCFAQEKALKVIQEDTKKAIVFKNNSRVKIKTTDGTRLRGKLFIKDDTIYVNNIFVNLEDIIMIKKDPLVIYILTSAFLIYTAASTAGIAFIMGVLVDSSSFLLAIPAAAVFYTGLKAPNFSKKYKLENGRSLQLVDLPITP